MRKLAAVFISVLSSVACAQKAPFTIVSPKDGDIVREKVKVECLRGKIPAGGFVALFVDGRGIYAQKLDEANKAFSLIWDSKEPFADPDLSGDNRFAKDGPHTLEVVAYDNKGARMDASRVTLTLKNVYTPKSDQPIDLRLKFRQGEDLRYKHDSYTEFTEARGPQQWPLKLLGRVNIYRTWDQTTEDLIDKESAIVSRYFRPEALPDSNIYVAPNTIGPLDELGRRSYLFFHANGENSPTVKSRNLGERGFEDLILLKDGKVRPGDKWQSSVRLTADQTKGDVIDDVASENTFTRFEWEGGVPCARIDSKISWSGSPVEVRVWGQDRGLMSATSLEGTLTTYVSLTSHKVVRISEEVFFKGDFLGNVTSSIVGKDKEREGGGDIGPGSDDPGRPNAPGIMLGGGGGADRPNAPGMNIGGGTGGVVGEGGSGVMRPGGQAPGMGGLQATGQKGQTGNIEGADRTKATMYRRATLYLTNPK